jgi:hypothetical protein
VAVAGLFIGGYGTVGYHANSGHAIDFSRTKVTAKVKNFKPRLIREALETGKCKENFNRDGDLKINHTWNHVLTANKHKMTTPSSLPFLFPP